MRAAIDWIRRYERLSPDDRALARRLLAALDECGAAQPSDVATSAARARSSSAERMRRHRDRHIERHSDASQGVTSGVTCVTSDASHPSHVTQNERHSDASQGVTSVTCDASHQASHASPRASAHTPSRARSKEISNLSSPSPLSPFSQRRGARTRGVGAFGEADCCHADRPRRRACRGGATTPATPRRMDLRDASAGPGLVVVDQSGRADARSRARGSSGVGRAAEA